MYDEHLLIKGSFSGVLLCHTSLPSQVSSWNDPLVSPLLCSGSDLFLGLGGGAGGVNLDPESFFGFGRVGGGTFLLFLVSGITSPSGMVSRPGLGPWEVLSLGVLDTSSSSFFSGTRRVSDSQLAMLSLLPGLLGTRALPKGSK